MAVGDRITSARTAGLMRRINALENLHTYGAAAATSTSAASSQGEFHGGPTQHVFYPVASAGIKKNNHSLSSETEFCAEGTGADEVNTIGSVVILAYNEVSDILYVFDSQGLRAFDDTGSEIWKNTDATFSWGIAGLDDDRCMMARVTEVASGTTTSTTANKLVNSGEDFTSTVTVGDVVTRTLGGTAQVDAIDNNTTLSISSDIMSSGEEYTIDGARFAIYSDSGVETIFDTLHPGEGPWNIRQFGATSAAISSGTTGFGGKTGECKIFNADDTVAATHQSTYRLTSTPYWSDDFGGVQSTPVNGMLMGVAAGSQQGASANDIHFFRSDGTYIKNFSGSITSGKAYLMNTTGAVFVTGNDGAKITKHNPTSTQTTWYRYPTPGNDTGKVTLGTVDFGFSVPSDTVLTGFRPHYFELRDMRTAIEALAISYYYPVESGTATSTSASKLVDSGQNFDDTVAVGDVVSNTTDSVSATVLVIDSATTLSLSSDIFVSGETYEIKTNLVVSGSVNNNLFTIAIGTVTDWTTPTITHLDRIRETEYSDIESVLTILEASSLA